MNLSKTLLLIAIVAFTTIKAAEFNCSNHMLNKPWNQWNLVGNDGYSKGNASNLNSTANLTFCRGLMNPNQMSCCNANAVETLKKKFTTRFQKSMTARKAMDKAFEAERTSLRTNLDVLLTIQAKQFALQIDFINASNTFATFAVKMLLKWMNETNNCTKHQLYNEATHTCTECELPNQFVLKDTCLNCSDHSFYNPKYSKCQACRRDSFLKNKNDSSCTTCNQSAYNNSDYYNGFVCKNCSVGLMYKNSECEQCNGGMKFNRSSHMCENMCGNMDFWVQPDNCLNCSADSYFAKNMSRPFMNSDCRKCNGGNMTMNGTDFFNRTTRQCEACPAAFPRYNVANNSCLICGEGYEDDYFNRTNQTCMQCAYNYPEENVHYARSRQACTNCTGNQMWRDLSTNGSNYGCACLQGETWNNDTMMCMKMNLADDYKPKRVLEVVAETKNFLGFERELAQLKDLNYLEKGLKVFTQGLRSLQNSNDTKPLFPANSTLNYQNAPMTWNTSKDSDLFRLDGIQADEADEEREAGKYGNKTFDNNDTNKNTSNMPPVKNLTMKRKATMKSKALNGLRKLQEFKNRAFNAQKQCFRAVYKFSSTMACQVCSANFTKFITSETDDFGNFLRYQINLNATNQALMQEKCFSYIYYFYQLGQVRLDMSVGLEMVTKENAAFMVNSYEHVNKALRMKQNENMTHAEYNKTIDHLVSVMNDTMNNMTTLVERFDKASKEKMFWMKYFVQPKRCHTHLNCELSQSRFWDINFVNSSMDDLFMSQYPFNFSQSENFTRDEIDSNEKNETMMYLFAAGEFLKTGKDPRGLFTGDNKDRMLQEEPTDNITSKPDNLTVKYTSDPSVVTIDMENDANSVDMDNATNEYNVQDTAQNNTEDEKTVDNVNENSTDVPGEDPVDPVNPDTPTPATDSGVSVWVWVVLAVLGVVLVLAICGLVAGKMSAGGTHIDDNEMSHTDDHN